MKRPRTPFRCIGVQQARNLIRRDDVLMLDVRDAEAFARAHIEGALHMTVTNLSTVIDSTPRSRPILVYCYHGYASREYAQILSDFGFAKVYSLDGGYEAWSSRRRATARAKFDGPPQPWLAKQDLPPNDVTA